MGTAAAPALQQALGQVQAAIEAARAERAQATGRPAPRVTLVAASKRQPIAKLCALYDAGQRHFGENYVQELQRKAQALAATGRRPTWHLIGPLQRNKVRAFRGLGAVLQTVDSLALGHKLCAAVQQGLSVQRPLPVLMQVRLSAEGRRPGVAEGDALALGQALLQLQGLQVLGLMGVPPEGADPRPFFARLQALSQGLQRLAGGADAQGLSMGMSQDFRAAILEGATIVRVGSALFGPRTHDAGEIAYGLDPH